MSASPFPWSRPPLVLVPSPTVGRSSDAAPTYLPTVAGKLLRPLDVTFFEPYQKRGESAGNFNQGTRGNPRTYAGFDQLAADLAALLESRRTDFMPFDEETAQRKRRSCEAKATAAGVLLRPDQLAHADTCARIDSAKARLLGFTPGSFNDDYRKKDNVELISVYAGDYDNATSAEWSTAVAKLKAAGVAFFAYGSPKDGIPKALTTPEKSLRRRLLIALSRDVVKHEAESLQKIIPGLIGLEFDGSTYDASRLFYVGCIGAALPTCEGADGEALDVDAVLKLAVPDVEKPGKAKKLTAPVQAAIGLCPASQTPLEYGRTLCETLPPAVEGDHGGTALLRVARALRWGLELEKTECQALIAAHFNPRCLPEWSDAEIAHKVADAGKSDGTSQQQGWLLPKAAPNLPYIVQSGGHYWLREPGTEYYAVPIPISDLRVELKHQFSKEIDLVGHDGKLKSSDALLVEYSVMAKHLAADYAARGTTWDPSTRTLTAGYALPLIEPRRDVQVEAWLQGLAGGQLEDLSDLYQWIAGARQDRLNSLAAVLVLVGDPGIGKTFFFVALAMLWGERAPVPLKSIVQQFNSQITKCPIWLDDECEALKDGLISSSRLRSITAERTRSYEPKGKEKRDQHGCARIGLTANDIDDIRFPDVVGAGAVQALADRLALYTVQRSHTKDVAAALDRLRLAKQNDVDVLRITGHLAWVQDTIAIDATPRFLGTRADNSGALTAALSGAVEQNPEVFDYVSSYLLGACESKDVSLVASHGLVVSDGKLFAYPEGIRTDLQLKTVKQVHDALKPFVGGKRKAIRLGERSDRFFPLTLETLLKGLRLDSQDVEKVTACMGTDTTERRRRAGFKDAKPE